MRFLQGSRIKKIAGQDLFYYEMNRLNRSGGTCFFLGSKESTLQIIHSKALKEFPHVKVHSYSPPFKPVFSDSDNESMLSAVNAVKPDVLFIGMTAPKQEKWACQHLESLAAQHICCIGAVFDFYSGNYKRAPSWMIVAGLEWLYRLILEPSRMWRRYVLGNPRFILSLFREKFSAYTTQ
jgi:N-acetylglucosaminyldiphosphoundecaprenol N-acetyl-beta-D-mannosaminyltransferase